ncbi:MAG: DegT/DnrJ/EryC1/StrS aminotransferase family protein [Hyphomonadaceae bacterium]|nr:DegT/DnrJ/EryC1/StrS aminotransferase family protein [Hyphomonadaceae bacterium]
MAVHPRQRLYDINHFGFVAAMGAGRLNDGVDGGFAGAFCAFTGIDNVVPLSRGRVGLYFSVQEAVRATGRRKVVFCPFTIMDAVNMIVAGGGEPFFIDAAPGVPHPDLATIEAALDDDVAAVLITHYHTSHPRIAEIAELCRARGVWLIEDCAISLGARPGGRHVGSYGDAAFFSFGLFKFVSSYFGGAVTMRDPEALARVRASVDAWPAMQARELGASFQKGLKFSLITWLPVFRLAAYPLVRHGVLNDIEWIKKQMVNDPSPGVYDALPAEYRTRPSSFQLREWSRQIGNVEQDRIARVSNYGRLRTALAGDNRIGLPPPASAEGDACMNFPLQVSGDRTAIVKNIMREGVDVAIHYYRNCADAEEFAAYHRPLPNLRRFVAETVILPVYPGLPDAYVDRLAAAVRSGVAGG